MFSVTMLDADHGDCLLIEFGEPGRLKRILVDAGTPGTYDRALAPALQKIIDADGVCVIELFVITHVDEDHIGGALRLLEKVDKSLIRIKEIWFNGYSHLDNQPPVLGPRHGELLSRLINNGRWPWNKRFHGRAVMVPDKGRLPVKSVGGMKLTLLSPTFEKLQALKKVWRAVIEAAGLVPGVAATSESKQEGGFLGGTVEKMAAREFQEDGAAANGSSIAFIAEFEGCRVLFGADAHPSVLISSANRAPLNAEIPFALAALKLPHHGSRNNVSSELLEHFPASRYLVSSTGARFEHPNEEAIARAVLAPGIGKKSLYFNCTSKFNKAWSSEARRRKYGYDATYGLGRSGLRVEIG